jgi:hypothetical protein
MQGTKTKSTSNIPWVSAFSDQRSVMSNTHVQTAPNMQFNAHLLSVVYQLRLELHILGQSHWRRLTCRRH